MKIAIIGTNGVPSKYGGFETLVEYLVSDLASKYEITVYCSATSLNKSATEYKGAKLEYINLNANNWQSIPFDIISLLKECKQSDKILILGSSGCIVLPFLGKYKHKFIFNFGGLDWKRSKWNYFTKLFLKKSEAWGIIHSKYLISDNIGIQEYIKETYNRDSTLITYGGDQAEYVAPSEFDLKKYPFLKEKYIFTVARIQSDNNIEMMLNAFGLDSPMPFVFVGDWDKSQYGIEVKKNYLNNPNIVVLDAIYDQRELNVLRSNSNIYLHGHSAGGTNPALVEAMNLGLPVFAFDTVFNKNTTKFQAAYFSGSNDLREMIMNFSPDQLTSVGRKMLEIAKDEYQWKKIALQYSEVFNS